MAISFAVEDVVKPKLSYRLLIKWLKGVINEYHKKPGFLVVIFCSDSYLIKINREFLQHDYFTDIVTFDYCEKNIVSGDIFISLDRVAENSNLFGVTVNEELLRVIVHGILHLLGFGDSSKDEKIIMRNLESKYILDYKILENGCSEGI